FLFSSHPPFIHSLSYSHHSFFFILIPLSLSPSLPLYLSPTLPLAITSPSAYSPLPLPIAPLPFSRFPCFPASPIYLISTSLFPRFPSAFCFSRVRSLLSPSSSFAIQSRPLTAPAFVTILPFPLPVFILSSLSPTHSLSLSFSLSLSLPSHLAYVFIPVSQTSVHIFSSLTRPFLSSFLSSLFYSFFSSPPYTIIFLSLPHLSYPPLLISSLFFPSPLLPIPSFLSSSSSHSFSFSFLPSPLLPIPSFFLSSHTIFLLSLPSPLLPIPSFIPSPPHTLPPFPPFFLLPIPSFFISSHTLFLLFLPSPPYPLYSFSTPQSSSFSLLLPSPIPSFFISSHTLFLLFLPSPHTLFYSFSPHTLLPFFLEPTELGHLSDIPTTEKTQEPFRL
ncbi:hypothetical protein C7M84_016047, partial [Penaeus vannamei]